MVASSLAIIAAAPRDTVTHSSGTSALGVSSAHAFAGPASQAVHPDSSYPVIFSEMGLPGGKSFQVTLTGHGTSATTTDGGTDSIGFFESAGSYNYVITDISGWHQTTLPYHGSFVLTSAGLSEPTMVYTQKNYTVTFSESGLPSSLNFQVTLNGTAASVVTDGGTDSVSFSVPNSSAPAPSYAYQILDISGWHQHTLAYHGSIVVNGGAILEPTLAYVQVTYSVTFTETGLPSGQTFQVSVGGVPKSLTTNGGADSLTWTGLINNSYAYSVSDVSGWHQTAIPYNGNVVVNGASVTEPTLAFTKSLYSITFSESGLPIGETFEVTVGASIESLTSDGGTDSLLFTVANGSYSYSIADVSGWHQTTLPHAGSVLVNGAAVTEPTLVYLEVNYTLTFTESGLPTGTNWSITIDSNTHNSTTAVITFSEPNGTYGFTVNYVAGYAPTAHTGSEHVNGAALSAGVSFTQVTYAVTFTESGLPVSTAWSISINSHAVSSSSPMVVFHLPNGTFGYTVDYVSGWVPTQATGSFPVTGAPVSLGVSFTQVRYTVTFVESGLPTNHPKSWSAALDGVLQHTMGTSISFSVGNGSQPYVVAGPNGYRVSSVLPPSGNIVVNGGSVVQDVTFLRGSTPSLGFHEVGLAVGTHWCVIFGSTLCSTTNKIVAHNLTPGTYSYAVVSVGSLTTLVKFAGGSIAASGTVAFSHASSLHIRFAYAVTFTESGLPGSTAWQVNAGGMTVPSTSTTVVLYLTNGTYTFHVGHVTGYVASPGSGAIRVQGASLSVSVRYTLAPH